MIPLIALPRAEWKEQLSMTFRTTKLALLAGLLLSCAVAAPSFAQDAGMPAAPSESEQPALQGDAMPTGEGLNSLSAATAGMMSLKGKGKQSSSAGSAPVGAPTGAEASASYYVYVKGATYYHYPYYRSDSWAWLTDKYGRYAKADEITTYLKHTGCKYPYLYSKKYWSSKVHAWYASYKGCYSHIYVKGCAKKGGAYGCTGWVFVY
jgi:hypothetical protein